MENIEKKLGLYAIADKNTESYGIMCTGFDDKDTIDFYIKGFKDSYKSLDKYFVGDKLETEKNNFIDKIHDSYIYRIGYFDLFKGELVNDKILLADLFDFNIESEENEK